MDFCARQEYERQRAGRKQVLDPQRQGLESPDEEPGRVGVEDPAQHPLGLADAVDHLAAAGPIDTHLAAEIADEFITTVQPKRVRVVLTQRARGGIEVQVTVDRTRK